jgi:hypothetical protein
MEETRMAQLVGLQTQRQGRERPSGLRLAGASLVAAVVAVVASLVVYLLGAAVGLVDRSVVLPSLLGMGPLSIASVSVTAAAATLAAGLLLGLFVLGTRRPIVYFRVAATVLVVLSLSMPATIPGPPAGMRAVMAVLHVVVWAVSIGVLPTLARAGRNRP